jgi:hypothetical protein
MNLYISSCSGKCATSVQMHSSHLYLSANRYSCQRRLPTARAFSRKNMGGAAYASQLAQKESMISNPYLQQTSPLSSLRKRLVSIILLDPARTTLHLRYSLALLFSSMPGEYSEQANRTRGS